MGNATTPGFLDSGHDLAYVAVPNGTNGVHGTAPVLWAGLTTPLTSEYSANVTAASAPAHGLSVCTDGVRTGMACGATVQGGGHFTIYSDWSSSGYDAYLWWATASGGIVEKATAAARCSSTMAVA